MMQFAYEAVPAENQIVVDSYQISISTMQNILKTFTLNSKEEEAKENIKQKMTSTYKYMYFTHFLHSILFFILWFFVFFVFACSPRVI